MEEKIAFLSLAGDFTSPFSLVWFYFWWIILELHSSVMGGITHPFLRYRYQHLQKINDVFGTISKSFLSLWVENAVPPCPPSSPPQTIAGEVPGTVMWQREQLGRHYSEKNNRSWFRHRACNRASLFDSFQTRHLRKL